MLSKEEVLDNYGKLETWIDSRFGKRLASFLTVEELDKTNLEVKDEYRDSWTVENEWTEENIIKELVSDAEFGLEKAENGRGISSSLMAEVCEAWLFVLEETDLRKECIENGSHYTANISRNIIDTLKLIKKDLSK